jgi:hypothetical protein
MVIQVLLVQQAILDN